MFDIKEFVMKALNGMRGKYPDFQVREYAINWYSKCYITEEDLATVESWYAPVVEEVVTDEEITEPIIEEETTTETVTNPTEGVDMALL